MRRSHEPTRRSLTQRALGCVIAFLVLATLVGSLPVSAARTARFAPEVPNVRVVDQNGRAHRFVDDFVARRTVVVAFVYASCTTTCPTTTAVLRRVQATLGARVGRDIAFVSVTVDPRNDGPRELKAFAAKFDVAPGWSFVTGDIADVNALLQSFGVAAGRAEDHTPLLVIGNASRHAWTRMDGTSRPSSIARTIIDFADRRADRRVPTRRRGDRSARAYFTDLPLVDQHGRTVRFYRDLIADRTVIISTVFTSCTSACSRLTTNLAGVQQRLAGDRRIDFISITVDARHDRPTDLDRYARRHGARRGWTFLTGKPENVDWVLYKLGAYFPSKDAHATSVIIGNDRTGTWIKRDGFDDPDTLAAAARVLAETPR